ncbi:MAG: hypothetical protein ABH952_01330 [Candidatus Omnitrophota bacterium]
MKQKNKSKYKEITLWGGLIVMVLIVVFIIGNKYRVYKKESFFSYAKFLERASEYPEINQLVAVCPNALEVFKTNRELRKVIHYHPDSAIFITRYLIQHPDIAEEVFSNKYPLVELQLLGIRLNLEKVQ